jgi:glycine hydroxymethyltransferase
MGVEQMKQLAKWMNEVAEKMDDEAVQKRIAGEVKELCDAYPAPGL